MQRGATPIADAVQGRHPTTTTRPHRGDAVRAKERRGTHGGTGIATPRGNRTAVNAVPSGGRHRNEHGGAVRRSGLGDVVPRGQLYALHEQVARARSRIAGQCGTWGIAGGCARTCGHSAIQCTGECGGWNAAPTGDSQHGHRDGGTAGETVLAPRRHSAIRCTGYTGRLNAVPRGSRSTGGPYDGQA